MQRISLKDFYPFLRKPLLLVSEGFSSLEVMSTWAFYAQNDFALLSFDGFAEAESVPDVKNIIRSLFSMFLVSPYSALLAFLRALHPPMTNSLDEDRLYRMISEGEILVYETLLKTESLPSIYHRLLRCSDRILTVMCVRFVLFQILLTVGIRDARSSGFELKGHCYSYPPLPWHELSIAFSDVVHEWQNCM